MWEKAFSDVKNREMLRVNKENSSLQKMQGSCGRTEDRVLKKQVLKASRKIQKVFKGVIDDDDLNINLDKEV